MHKEPDHLKKKIYEKEAQKVEPCGTPSVLLEEPLSMKASG